MDPCPFLRILVGNLAVKSQASTNSKACSTSLFSGKVHPQSSPFFCKIEVKGVESQSSPVPLISEREAHPQSLAASFDFSKSQIVKKQPEMMKIWVYKGPANPSNCVFTSGAKLMGKISIPLDLTSAESRACTFHNGWVGLSKKQLVFHLTVRAEPDPRFVFRFDGEPECSPQVFQIKGEVKQPVFTCKFSFRDREKSNPESESHFPSRKGWSITVHDLSGSPVAVASMVTPFVPSPGSHRVSRSNPGAWLIIRPDGDGTWKPWGRLEAWRQPNNSNAVGCRFQVLPETADPVILAASTISSHHGGKFTIDVTSGVTPVNTPSGSWDLSSGSGSSSDLGFEPNFFYKGFVMSATVDGEGKCSKPEVEVGVQHVTCTEDAAAFVALAAALDLSIDACKLFSQKLRKELRQ